MQYLWESFDIKTYPAWTVVFVDGIYRDKISKIGKHIDIKTQDTTYEIVITDYDNKLPIHIIYVGTIADENILDIDILAKSARVNMTAKIITEKPAKLNVFIKNTGENSKFDGKIIVNNKSDLKIDINADHLAKNTGIFVKTKTVAHSKSGTNLYGVAKIGPGIENCESDIYFSALCAPDIKRITISPNQRILSEPARADHSASIYRGNGAQIQYLRESGLATGEVDTALREAFENDF